MIENTFSPIQTKKQAVHALKSALARFAPSVEMNGNGYTTSFRDNLFPTVATKDFEADLRHGDGNELETKFRAAHSSSALGVNCFTPFRNHLADLTLLGAQGFDALRSEAKCSTGLRGRRAANLDLLLQAGDVVVGIESKLTEYLTRHQAKFSSAYEAQIQDHRRQQGWFREMQRLMEEPRAYDWLNAAQLIKHAFGLDHRFPGKSVSLLYLYWEPEGINGHPVFAEHRREIENFSNRIAGSGPIFRAMSYPKLWASWRTVAPDWLTIHLRNLSARYGMCLPTI